MNSGKFIEPGKWCTTFDENGHVITTVYDESFRRMMGFGSGNDDANEAWLGSIHPDDAQRVAAYTADCFSKHPAGMDYDIEYRMMTQYGYHWFHDLAHCERREDGSIMRCDGFVFDIQEGLDKAEIIRHEKLGNAVFSYLLNHDGDPIDLLREFAPRIREMLDCDQIIYRDLEETRIMVNSPEIEKTWSVPIGYCQQCAHFDAHHPMYKDGYTEMDNCQEGWRGIPVHKDCPIKSSLTRIVYCDGEAAGYLAIHYVQKYHRFTEIERSTVGEFANMLSVSLSRYAARMRAGEVSSIKKTLSQNFVLSDQFDPIMVVNPETGEYDWLMSVAGNVAENTAMSLHGEDFYKDIGIDAATIIHPDTREHFRQVYSRENLMRIAETGEVQETENQWYIQTEGQYRWKYNKLVRMLDDSGKAFVVVGVIDTTEARKKEDEIREQKELLEKHQALAELSERLFALADQFEALYDVELESGRYSSFIRGDFYRKNVSGKLIESEDYFADLRKNIDAAIYPEDREGLYNTLTRESIRRVLAENAHFDYYYRISTEDGPLWLKMRIVYKDAEKSNVIIGVFNAEKDVEAQQLAEQKKQLEIAREEADNANKSKTDFLFNMSHDIRTPMNAIMGFAAMAKKYSAEQDKVNSYLDKFNTSGHQLLSLVNQVLEMARIESGHIEVMEMPVSIRKEFATMVAVLSEQAVAKSLKFKYDLDIQHAYVLADEARMNSITLNIVGNALKYTPEGGVIDFRLKEIPCTREGYASYVLTVEDTGIGMSEAFQKNIFEPFVREQNSTVSRIQGTGLGMTIVKKLVDILGGSITVRSEPGKGTRFDVTASFKINEETEEKPESENDIDMASFRGIRVLLTEDNELNREIAKDILEEGGFIVDEAEDGAEAVDALREKGPDFYDFILMDIQMPFMNGYEATRAIRAMYPDAHIPIIALSANAFEEDKQAALDAGMNDHVAKPIEIVKLFGVITKYL